MDRARGERLLHPPHQFIAAQLNVASGATLGDLQDEFDAAKALFETYAPSEIAEASQSLRDQFIDLGAVLADYNEGALGPGHCDYIEDPPAVPN